MGIYRTILKPTGQLFKHFGQNLALTFARSSTRARKVKQPLANALAQGWGKSTVTPTQYHDSLYLIGARDPRLAAKTVKGFMKKVGIGRKETTNLHKAEKSEVLQALRFRFEFQFYNFLTWKFLLIWTMYGLARALFATNNAPVEVDFADLPPPLTITLADGDYTLYGGEEWNPLLRQECKSHFTKPDALTISQLSTCFAASYDDPDRLSRFSQYLHYLEANTSVMTPQIVGETERLLKLALSTPPLEIEAESTANEDYLANPLAENPKASRLRYADYYRQVYGAPPVPVPNKLSHFSFYILPGRVLPVSRLPISVQIIKERSIYVDESGQPKAVLYEPQRTEELPAADFGEIGSALAVLKHFEPATMRAAAVLHQYHGQELTFDQARMLLDYKLFEDLIHLRYEDPWQDIAAADSCGSAYAEQFEQVFADVPNGIDILGILVRPPWSLATFVARNFERQGFGPYQVIFGLLKEASRYPVVRSHWQGLIPASSFANDDSTLRFLFDRPTDSCAIVFDYILTRLEQTAFSNPEVRKAPFYRPPVEDPKFARQLSLMSTALILSLHPERDLQAPTFAVMTGPSQELFLLISELLGTPQIFPPEQILSRTLTTTSGERLLSLHLPSLGLPKTQ